MPEQITSFSVGDRVRHRVYGGPVMTVEEVYPTIFQYRFRCEWAEGGRVRRQLFRADELEEADREPGSVPAGSASCDQDSVCPVRWEGPWGGEGLGESP